MIAPEAPHLIRKSTFSEILGWFRVWRCRFLRTIEKRSLKLAEERKTSDEDVYQVVETYFRTDTDLYGGDVDDSEVQ